MTSGQDQSGGSDKRRFARLPINLDGLISIDGQTPVPCTARDFCVGGMFISADPAVYASVSPETPAVLYFALFIGGEKKDFQVNLLIARAVAKGIGVSFNEPDQETLDLLNQLAAAAAPPAPPDSTAALSETQQGFASEFATVVSPLTELVLEHVGNICDHFLERSDEVLFLAARDAGNNVDETRFLDGQREMRNRQDEIRAEVPTKIERGISIIGNPLSDQDKEPASMGLSDLSLVEKDEFEEFLAVSEMVSELEPLYNEALYALGQRFTYLSNREVEVSSIPIGPSVMCGAIAEGLKSLQSDRGVTKRIFEVLHDVMSADLGALYDKANELLVEQGIVPKIEKGKPVIKKKKGASRGVDASTDGAPDDTLNQPDDVQEEDFGDLMPSPDNYQGRPQVAPAAPRPAPQVHAAQPQIPAGYPQGPAVQAAPPSTPMPSGFVQAAPPAAPPGYAPVQGAPPSIPAGAGIQAAPPTIPAGAGVQVAPPTIPAGAGIQAAPPSVPAGPGVQSAPQVAPADPAGITAAPPAVPGAVSAAPPAEAVQGGMVAPAAYAGHGGTLPPGWASPGVHYAPPSPQQAYSTAQAQLALRRQLVPDQAPNLSGTVAQRGDYSQAQIVNGLSDIQQAFAETADPQMLDVDAIKQRITDALISDGAPEKMVGGEANDAIEVVANLFSSLLHDAMVTKGAKSHLTRLQPSVHKAAIIDSNFFEAPDHPVRQVINRIAQVRDGKSDEDRRRHERVQELVTQANHQFHDDVSVFEPVVAELDNILREQQSDYENNVGNVVASCEQQQRVREERRDQSFEATDETLERSDFPEEWSKWLDKSKALEVGERMLMNANSPNSSLVKLVWKEERNSLFVFVDDLGNKASTLTLEQVAMYLRRGVLKSLDRDEGEPAMERAMFGVVDRFHSQVEDHATRDPLTGFLNRKFFVDEIDALLPEAETAAAKNAVLAQIAIENLKHINDEFGISAGDALIKAVGEAMSEVIRGKNIVFGRLGGAELSVYWPTGGLENIYKKMQSHIEKLTAVSVTLDDDSEAESPEEEPADEAETVVRPVSPEIVIGLTGAEDGLAQAEGLLSAAAEACESAREMGAGSIYVTGSESRQREQLEQMVGYANKALERDCLMLHGQNVTSLTDTQLPPALHIAIGARDRSDKPIPTQIFTPALERCDIAAEIDMWAFKQTLAWMLEHEDEVDNYAIIVIPLSSASMKDEELPNKIMGEFMETPVPPGKICFEIPDRDVVENVVEAGELINTLKEFGCRFVLDEFGSGHDNYDYVKELDVDYVTVKTGFVGDAQKNPKDFAMAKSINELVHFMGKKTIAKQETGLELAETMREIGIDFLYDLAEQAQLAP